MDLVKKERLDFTSSCAIEAGRIVEEVEAETQKLDQVEREAADFLKVRHLQFRQDLYCNAWLLNVFRQMLTCVVSRLRCIIFILIGIFFTFKGVQGQITGNNRTN